MYSIFVGESERDRVKEVLSRTTPEIGHDCSDYPNVSLIQFHESWKDKVLSVLQGVAPECELKVYERSGIVIMLEKETVMKPVEGATVTDIRDQRKKLGNQLEGDQIVKVAVNAK